MGGKKQQGKVEARSTLNKYFYKNEVGFCEGQSLISIQTGWAELSKGLGHNHPGRDRKEIYIAVNIQAHSQQMLDLTATSFSSYIFLR